MSVTETDARLGAEIDPHGYYTAYEFQIDTNGSYDYPQRVCPLEVPGYEQCQIFETGDPLPAGLVEPRPGSIPAAAGDQLVSIDLASVGATLDPSTTYHYRVIASNGSEATGDDQTFTTPGPESSTGGGQGTTATTIDQAAPTQTGTQPESKAATMALKLAKALAICAKKPKRLRASCVRRTRRKYATLAKKKHTPGK
jgi:hypothetical protein